jgi:hypothetical protein
MQIRITVHQHRPPEDIFYLFQVPVVAGLQHLGYRWIHPQHDIFPFDRLRNLLRLYQDLANNSLNALYVPSGIAIWAR